MSEQGELWRALRTESKQQRKQARDVAKGSFHEAAAAARKAGLSLIQRDDHHYQLRGNRHGDWLINLYPGNGRVYADRNKAQAPFLELPEYWTLMDLVDAAIKAVSNE